MNQRNPMNLQMESSDTCSAANAMNIGHSEKATAYRQTIRLPDLVQHIQLRRRS